MNYHDQAVIDELRYRKHPVLIYGNMVYAIETMHFLQAHGINVEAFIVDGWANKSEKIEDIPVKLVDEVIHHIEEYDVVIGFQNIEKCRAMLELQQWLKTNVYMLWEPIAHVEWKHEWYVKHISDFVEARECLADGLSKQTLDAMIEAREKGNVEQLIKLARPDQYFNYLMYEKDSSEEVFLDCGAFNGDTILAYNQFTGGRFKKIIVFEPEKTNVEAIRKNTEKIGNINIVEKGLWNKETTLHFTSDSSASRIEESGTTSVEVTSIDSVMDGKMVSFIKMDIEGAEYEALCGAKNTISKWMPKLAVCVYHKCDDIFKFISFLKEFTDGRKKYSFYLRHHTCAAYETVLYAVPEKKNDTNDN